MFNKKYEIQQFLKRMLSDMSITSFICHLSEAGEVKSVLQHQLWWAKSAPSVGRGLLAGLKRCTYHAGWEQQRCSVQTLLGSGHIQSISHQATQPKIISLEPREKLQWGREVPLNILLSFCTRGILAVTFIFLLQAPW